MSRQLSETQAKRTQRGLQCGPGASRDVLQSKKAPRRLKQPAPQSHSRRGSPPSIAYMSHPAVAIPYVATRGHLHSPGTAEAGDLLALSIYVGLYPKPPVGLPPSSTLINRSGSSRAISKFVCYLVSELCTVELEPEWLRPE